MRSSFRPRRSHARGLSLVEVLVTLAVLLVIFVAVLQFMTSTDAAWKSAAADPFAEAQDAFDTMTRNLASATLEPYQDYVDATGAFRTNSTATFTPDHAARRSDLDFICAPSSGTNGLLTSSGRITTGSALFFVAPQGYTQTQAHTGLGHLLNALGYFVEFGTTDTTPAFIFSPTPVYRWRLKQVVQPAESLQIYSLGTSAAWTGQLTQVGATTPVLADNIVTLLFLPERTATDAGAALAPTFAYDSRDATNPLTHHQLPPRVRIALVAMDEASALLLTNRYGSAPPPLVAPNLFQAAAQLDADLATLDASLTAQKITHRLFQREIVLNTAAWSNATSP